MSTQLRTAAKTMGLNVDQMSTSERRSLSNCLANDAYNINLAAMHLRQLTDHDKLLAWLDMNDVKIIGSDKTEVLTRVWKVSKNMS